jgi:hypothetical protein
MPFIPLDSADTEIAQASAPETRRGFIPLDEPIHQPKSETAQPQPEQLTNEPGKASVLRTVLLNNPLTALGETALNLGTMSVALPVAGLAGLGAMAGRVLGLTDKSPGDVVQSVSEGLTYAPRGELGQGATDIATYPFQKLAEAGQYAGGKTLDASGSPVLATAIDTAVNALPMAISPGAKLARRVAEKPKAAPREQLAPNASENVAVDATAQRATVENDVRLMEVVEATAVPGERGFKPIEPLEAVDATQSQTGFTPLQAAESLPEAPTPVETAPLPKAGPVDLPAVRESSGSFADSLATADPQPAPHPPAIPEPASIRYTLVEASELKPSHDVSLKATDAFPDQLKRPDWSRTDAEQRVQGIVHEFDPPRLADSVDDTTGAPIMAPDGIIEAGSARAIALQRVYQANGQKAENYRQFLRDNAERLGLDPAEVDNLKKPVLVRVPDEPLTFKAEVADLPPEGKVNAMAPGANYVGFINDAPVLGSKTPATASAGARLEPIRREDILIPFAKALGTGIYEGRITTKGVMGHFRPKLEEVRIKRHADLETAAHELAHLIDHRVPEIRKTWSAGSGPDWQVRRAELQGLSYDKGKIYEGFAEFVRHYMTQPDVAMTRAPVFYKWFEDFTARHEYGPAIENARKGMTDWFNQDAIDRARSKIGDHRPMTDALDGQWDSFRQATVDDLHGVYRMERELKGGKIEPNGAYESARLSRASSSIADGAVRFGAPVKKPDGSYGWRGKGLEDILKPVSESLDDALLYFVGRSARELQAQSREHLFTLGEVDAMLKLRRPEFDKAFSEYQEWNSTVMDFAEAQGVINPQTRAMWKRLDYLPFHRVASPEGFKGKPGDWSGIKALTGGTENIKDVLGNMTRNAAMLIDTAVKNEARQKIATLAEQAGGGKFMIKIPAESRPVKIATSAVIDAILKGMGLDAPDSPAAVSAADRVRRILESSPAMLEVMQQNMPPAGGNVVAVLKDGKPVWYEVGDPILLRALESIDRTPQPWIVKWLGLPKRIGQASIVLTPDFMIANLARDTIMGSVMSRTGFKPVIDSLQGMRLRLTNDPIYKEFIANGGGLSSMYLDEAKFRTKLERFYTKQGVDYRTVLDAPHKLLSFIETLGDSFESSTRLGEYKRAVDAGENPRHAAYLARDVSTDFAMKGDSKALGFMYDTVMFLRPAMVSWDRLYRGLAHDPNKGAIATKAGMMALMSAGLYLLNKDDQRYQDLPDWDRDTHWHFFIGDEHFRYPKIWEIGAIASAAERTAEKIIDADLEGLGKDFARILGQTFSLNLMPQIIAPAYEQATNRNNFTKAPIETPGMENQQPFMRAKPTTSETMKATGMATANLPESLQVNPVRAEALLRGYFNTYALYGLALTDKVFFADKGPTMRTDQLPVVRRFYSEEPPLNTKYETQFYDTLGEAKRLHGSLRELDKIGRSEVADQKETNPMAAEAKPLEHAAKNLQSINQEMRKVRRSSDYSPDEKRQRLDALTVERNDLLKRAVLDSKAALKKTEIYKE